MAPTKERPATKSIATNREARHEYFVLEALETGVELKGTEVKSLRAGAQERDPAAAPAVQAAGLHPCAALALFQAWPRKDGSGLVQGQKAVRQACRCRPARCKAFH